MAKDATRAAEVMSRIRLLFKKGHSTARVGRCERYSRDNRPLTQRGNAILRIGPDRIGLRSSPGDGRPGAIAASFHEPYA
jgi:hypothetical protein